MERIKILADGDSPQERANHRGKLFEKLMAEVLRHYGYSIDRICSVNYAGMEIDIEGKLTLSETPLYAECKCYETEIDSPKLHAFYGKYMTRWRKNHLCHGLFIALPGINASARGFFKDNCETDKDITLKLLEEEAVLKVTFETIVRPDIISKYIKSEMGTPGDSLLLYTDIGVFWVQYVIPIGSAIPKNIILFDSRGNPITDRSTIEYLTKINTELRDFDIIEVGVPISFHVMPQIPDEEEIVEVRGSSQCFEYQFPASPQHFVGRHSLLSELETYVATILNKETSSRGILFEANSGWGKSSLVLATVARLAEKGHFAVAIDSRSVSTSQFIIRVLDFTFRKFGNFDGLIPNDKIPKTITGFSGMVESIVDIGHILGKNDKLLLIFLDQFENVFYVSDALRRIRDLLLKICDAQTNIILGFSWKTDLIGLTSEFPYKLRDAITDSSKRVVLDTFTEVETKALLDRLSIEIRAPLRKDLQFFLSEFSQGYPWLLKKLCAHVKSQRESGAQQSDIAKSLLNVEQLFKEDLLGPSPEEEEALRYIAKAAPISIVELGDEFDPSIVQSLVNRRLVVRVGTKYDIYWDIFRDYLNTNRLPIQENYILRAPVGSVLNATKILMESNGSLDITNFQNKARLTEKSFYNVAKDMALLGLAKIEDGFVKLMIKFPIEPRDFQVLWRDHLQVILQRNRLISQISRVLQAENTLTIQKVSKLLEESCPYISATKQTWLTYARIFAGWMDTADLAILNNRTGLLSRYEAKTEVRERNLFLAKRHGTIAPLIQYSPIEEVAIRIGEALKKKAGRVDWTGLKKSTIYKSLATLEDIGFITRKSTTSITVTEEILQFAFTPSRRPSLFAKGALKIKSFATFVEILEAHKDEGATIKELGLELTEKLALDWKETTAETNAKIMLDWARHINLAPGIFTKSARGPRKGWKTKPKDQLAFL